MSGFTEALRAFVAERYVDGDATLPEIIEGLAIGLGVALGGFQGDDPNFDDVVTQILDKVRGAAQFHRMAFTEFQARLRAEEGKLH